MLLRMTDDLCHCTKKHTALAASILLQREKSKPLETPPFRFAIFICASLPFSVDQVSGFELTRVFKYINDPLSGDIKHWKSLVSEEQYVYKELKTEVFELDARQIQNFVEPVSRASFSSNIAATNSSPSSYSDSDSASIEDPTLSGYDSLEGIREGPEGENILASSLPGIMKASPSPNGTRIFRFHPEVDSVRISIPTAHIYGKNDPYLSQSMQLINMSQKGLMKAVVGNARWIPGLLTLMMCFRIMAEHMTFLARIRRARPSQIQLRRL
jgi:hypothetical protein